MPCAEDVTDAPEYATTMASVADEGGEYEGGEALVELHRMRDRPTLLRVSAPWCARCGPFADSVKSLGRQYDVRMLHNELSDENRDVVDKFSITRLPAYVLCVPTPCPEESADTLTIRQGTEAIEHLHQDVREACGLKQKFTLNADF